MVIINNSLNQHMAHNLYLQIYQYVIWAMNKQKSASQTASLACEYLLL